MAENEITFQDRLYMGGEAVYAAIERGEYENASQVEAALMDNHLDASDEKK